LFVPSSELEEETTFFKMTATFDVEEVLSKLNVVEKVSLLAGM